MGARLNIRVYAHPNRGDAIEAPRDSIDAIKFLLAFGVEAIDSLLQGKLDFGLGFADPGKDTAMWVSTCREDALQFTTADDIEPAAQFRKCP